MRPVSFGPGATGAQLSYRPRETIHDGSGWSSEVVALLLRDNTWARLSLGSLGLPADLWPGQDMLGPGDLNEDGSKLAFAADRGVLVIDLATGAHRLHAGEAGPVGLITWRPGGTRLAADRIERGRDIIVDVRSGDVTAAPAGALEVGSGEFTSWSAADRVAHRDWGHGRHAVRVTDVVSDKSVATLTWSGRTNMFLHVHGWWDLDRILLSMDRSLVTWAPATGEVRRVATLPRSDTGREHASVGLDFPDPLG